jgi:hypothetical protein
MLHSLLCMHSIMNESMQSLVQARQLDLLKAFREGEEQMSKDILAKLKKEVEPEQHRLIALCAATMEKYALIGGFEHMATLPDDFDENKGQSVPAKLQNKPKEVQVQYLLVEAAYRSKVLDDICLHVKEALHVLARSAKNASSVKAEVDKFMKKHGLTDCASALLGYEVTSDERFPPSLDILGHYSHCGYCNGLPSFRQQRQQHSQPTQAKESPSAMYIYHSRVQSDWNIGSMLNSNGRKAFLPEEESSAAVDGSSPLRSSGGCSWRVPLYSERVNPSHPLASCPAPAGTLPFDKSQVLRWQVPSSSKILPLKLTPIASLIPVRDGLADFLTQRANDPKFHCLLSLGDELMQVKLAPSKDPARALEKGPKWLLDANRCTLVFDSPVVLVVAFHLVSSKVKELGGKICRLENQYFKSGEFVRTGGALKNEQKHFKAPPSLHINVLIDGWTFEMMFMLQDFMSVKERMHKYYEISRASEAKHILMPVFDPPLQSP